MIKAAIRALVLSALSLPFLSSFAGAQGLGGLSQQDALADQLSGQISTKSGPVVQKPQRPITNSPQQETIPTVSLEPKIRPPLPPEEPTEFQRQIEQSIGSKLPIFGQSLFDGVPDTFAPLDRVPVTAD